MISRALEGLYDELERIGIMFEGYEVRRMEEPHNGAGSSCDCGILKDKDGEVLTTKRLGEVLAIVQKWNAYLVINPEVREMRHFWEYEGDETRIGQDSVCACFLQADLFQALMCGGMLACGALKRSFLYIQEDEEALILEDTMKNTLEEIRIFRRNAYDCRELESSSKRLREWYAKKYTILYKGQEIEGYLNARFEAVKNYMGDDTKKGNAESFFWANHCISVITRKI